MNPGTCAPRNGGGSVGGRRVVKKSAVTGLSLWVLCVFAVPLASRANEAGRVLPERVQLSNVAHFTAEAQTDAAVAAAGMRVLRAMFADRTVPEPVAGTYQMCQS